MPNRLSQASSPYLLQHADNPVDWWEWGEDAFAQARSRDVPVLLSVGYAACHWCHVMAHESFEDPAVAAVLDECFVCVKVDREERPDVDAVYMAATQALTGRGGWPMTVLLDHDRRPFWAGTYLPPGQLVGLARSAQEVWRDRRSELEGSASSITEAIGRMLAPAPAAALSDDDLQRAVDTLAGQFDAARGGFGGAPKFPPSMVLELLLRHHARTGSQDALAMATTTLEAMARGGIYDQLAGGFARYSVDADWVVPHFEKMLYDNALLARVYLHHHLITGSDLSRRIALETADFIVRDLGTGQGGFASALDADTDGVEGLTYAWTPAQLREVLGEQDGDWAARLLEVTEAGTFEGGTSTLQLRADPAAETGHAGETDASRWAELRSRLLAARRSRPQPGRDDKVVASWNGLAVAALAEIGALLDRPDLIEAARAAADLLLGNHLVEGRLRRVSKDGVVGVAAGLADDHGNLAEGLLVLHEVTGQTRWLGAALRLLELAREHYGEERGGFYDTADDAERLVVRPSSASDNAEPSGISSLAAAHARAGALIAAPDLLEVARAAVEAGAAVAHQDPRFAGWTLATAQALSAGPVQVAVILPDEPSRATGEPGLTATARRLAAPGSVVVEAVEGSASPAAADRPTQGGRPTAYVCRGTVCSAPVTSADALRSLLSPLPEGKTSR